MDAQREAEGVRRQLASALGCTYIVGRQYSRADDAAWSFVAWDMARARPVVIAASRRIDGRTERLTMPTGGDTHDLHYSVSLRADDPGYLPPPARPRWLPLKSRWSPPAVEPRRAVLAFCAFLLLVVMGDRQPPRAQPAPPPSGPMTSSPIVAVMPAAFVEPAPTSEVSAGDVAMSDDDAAVTRAYHAVLAVFPESARRELDRAQHVWLTDRTRACTTHATASRAHCLHVLATRRVAELRELLARAQ
jgi:hypothetical protein